LAGKEFSKVGKQISKMILERGPAYRIRHW